MTSGGIILSGGKKSKLPTAYTRLAYLESPGSADTSVDAYFSLPINATSGVDDLRIQTQHFIPKAPVITQIEGVGTDLCCLSSFGLSVAYEVPKVFISFDGVTNHPSGDYPAADINLFSDATYGVWQTYETHRGLSDVSLKENGITKASFVPEWKSNLPANNEIGVFGRINRDNYKFYSLFGRKKTYKLWVNDELKYDLVPCVNPDGEVCFYDMVTETYIKNAGSLPFVAGVDTREQLLALLQNLPDRTGLQTKSICIRMAQGIITESMAPVIDAMGEIKNWEIIEAV